MNYTADNSAVTTDGTGTTADKTADGATTTSFLARLQQASVEFVNVQAADPNDAPLFLHKLYQRVRQAADVLQISSTGLPPFDFGLYVTSSDATFLSRLQTTAALLLAIQQVNPDHGAYLLLYLQQYVQAMADTLDLMQQVAA